MLDSIGTSESVMVSIDKPILTKEVCDHGFSCYCSTLEGKYVVLGGLGTAGAILTWFRDQLGESETGKAAKGKKSAYNVLMEEAEKSQPGASGIAVKERCKVMRGFSRYGSASLIMDGWTVYYNYIRHHIALRGSTPAEAAGINIKLGRNRWQTLILRNN
jgi:xylulokinase